MGVVQDTRTEQKKQCQEVQEHTCITLLSLPTTCTSLLLCCLVGDRGYRGWSHTFLAFFRWWKPIPSPSLSSMCMVDYCGFGRTLLFWWSKENWCFWGTNRFDFTPCKTDGLKYILYLLWINTWVQLLHLGNDGIKLLLVRRMRQTSIEANSVSLVNGEADGAAVRRPCWSTWREKVLKTRWRASWKSIVWGYEGIRL